MFILHRHMNGLWKNGQKGPHAKLVRSSFSQLEWITRFHFTQNCVTIFQPTLRSGVMVTSGSVSNWQGLFVRVLKCSEKTSADSWRRQEEGSHNKFPHARHKMSSFPWLRHATSHPAEKSRHLKLCDMCQRHSHWASSTDGAGVDRPRVTGAGWGTHWVWCVSLPIAVRDASQAATPTQTALWDGRGMQERVDICSACTLWMGRPACWRVV